MINGTIAQILTQKENDWGRYKVNCIDGKKLLCVGIIPDASVGMGVCLEGDEEDNKYGHQFKISSVLHTEADENAGVRRFLTDGYIKGIGAVKAENIIRMFGSSAIDLFETEEGRQKLALAKGISDKVIENAMPSFEENRKYKDIVLFLNGTGTKAQVEKIYKTYGDKALPVLKKNPYRLQMDLDGFGFKKADKLALATGMKMDSKERIMAGIKFIIEDAETKNGDCFLTMDEVYSRVAAELVPMVTPASLKNRDDAKRLSQKILDNAAKNWPENKEKFMEQHSPSMETVDQIAEIMNSRAIINDGIFEALSSAIEEGSLVNSDGHIYTKKMFEIEGHTAEMISKMVNSHPVRFIKKETIEKAIKTVEERKTKALNASGKPGMFSVTDEQRKAVYVGLMNRVSIISGGPGRGKTAISEIIAEAFLMSGFHYSKNDIIMLAPTGRAAQRITESTGYPAMTAHRAVLSAKSNKNYPSGKLILCDETSMVDIYLAEQILYFAKDCNLVFVGDVDQIASVGPGRVLADMIASKTVPSILLTQGHRNTGSIANNSVLINQGMKIDRYTYDEHFVYIPCTSENIQDMMIRDYVKKVGEYGVRDVLLCSAMRERGAVCVNTLNTRLQEIFTKGKPEAKFSEGRVFRVGDRVMQTRNDYNFVKLVGHEKIEGVFNGEKGSVVKILPDPENDSYKLVIQFDDGSFGGYTKASAQNLTLAYATTLHKCQGSEAACMIMGYTYGDYILMNRSLFYTGETRAKKEFRFYGEEKWKYGRMLSAFDVAVGKTDDSRRHTALSERIVSYE